MRFKSLVAPLAAAGLFAVTFASGSPGVAQAQAAATPARGKILFLRCSSCHAIVPGAPAKIGPNGQVGGNLLSNGSRVDGTSERSVISPGVYIAEGAIVRDSVILNDTVIEAGAVVDRCIIDKNVLVSANARVGDGDDNVPSKVLPEVLNTGLTLVGKGAIVPEGYVIGRNVVVHAHVAEKAFGKRKKVASGEEVGTFAR